MRTRIAEPTNETQRIYWEGDHEFRLWNHVVVQEFARQRWDLLEKLLPVEKVSSALDVGAGSGVSTAYAPALLQQIWAGDQSLPMLGQHPFSRDRLIAFDAFALPFPDTMFDLVFAWEMLHHCADPERVVLELSRVSRRFVVLFEPNRNNPVQALFAMFDREHRWVIRYSIGYMIRLAQQADLRILHSGNGGWIFPNRTPEWMLAALKLLPYRLPILGISNFLVCEKVT